MRAALPRTPRSPRVHRRVGLGALAAGSLRPRLELAGGVERSVEVAREDAAIAEGEERLSRPQAVRLALERGGRLACKGDRFLEGASRVDAFGRKRTKNAPGDRVGAGCPRT